MSDLVAVLADVMGCPVTEDVSGLHAAASTTMEGKGFRWSYEFVIVNSHVTSTRLTAAIMGPGRLMLLICVSKRTVSLDLCDWSKGYGTRDKARLSVSLLPGSGIRTELKGLSVAHAKATVAKGWNGDVEYSDGGEA